MGVGQYLQLNPYKRSVALDLKRDADLDAMRAPLKTVYIFIYSVRLLPRWREWDHPRGGGPAQSATDHGQLALFGDGCR